jgi:hypothetical protein
MTTARTVYRPHRQWHFTYASGLAAARRLLAEAAPTAIFAANDQMALAALNAARAAGLRVPTNVTVVGFGDTGAAEHAAPTLTTVSMPRHELGVAAMHALLAALNSPPGRVAPRLLPCEIVLRESSAPRQWGAQRRNAAREHIPTIDSLTVVPSGRMASIHLAALAELRDRGLSGWQNRTRRAGGLAVIKPRSAPWRSNTEFGARARSQ